MLLLAVRAAGSCVLFCLGAATTTGAGIEIPSVTSNRLISIRVDPPQNARWVKFSHDPGFHETTGVTVRLTSLHDNLEHAMVDIFYPEGRPGDRAVPAGLPAERKQLRVLGVLAKLKDGGEVPSYATAAWMRRLLFSETNGVDARDVRNSVKNYWDQNSYGRIQFTGGVYPNWVELRETSHYVNQPPSVSAASLLATDALAAITREEPGYFVSQTYDFLIVLLPGDLSAVYRGYYEQTSVGAHASGIPIALVMDLPIHWESKYFGALRGELNTAIDPLHVQTRYPKLHVSGVYLATDIERSNDYLENHNFYFGSNPIQLSTPLPESHSVVMVDYSTGFLVETNVALDALQVDTRLKITAVQGVWLASDTNRLGTNFFTGGQSTHRDNHITLGQALPGSNREVVVEYSTGASYRVEDPEAPFFSAQYASTWYGSFLHELAHTIGLFVTFSDSYFLGDLYLGADLISNYGLMAGGNHNISPSQPSDPYSWPDPAHLDGYTKYHLGFLLPMELRYGESRSNVLIFASEESTYTEKTKLVKIPLRPPGEHAYRRMSRLDYSGEEYLLLELRRKGPLEGAYNFDSGLPHEGLVIYHVVERNSKIIGAFWENHVRIVDATPPTPEDWFWVPQLGPGFLARASLEFTPAPFGRNSSVTQYVHGDFWQDIGNSNLTFRLNGVGQHTIYAKFRDLGTNESTVSSATVLFAPGGADVNTNGIADSWERSVFGSLFVTPEFAFDDFDNDGATNLEEYLAGTNPRNAAVRLKLSLQPGVTNVLTFPTVRDVPYLLERTRSLTHPKWQPATTGPIYTFGGTFRFEDWLPPAESRFYRVRVVADE